MALNATYKATEKLLLNAGFTYNHAEDSWDWDFGDRPQLSWAGGAKPNYDNTDGYTNGSPITFASQLEGDLLLVHHGYFWRNEPGPLVGMKGRRVRGLMAADISLLAYHLPLDAHPEVGNNRQLGIRLGLDGGEPVDGLIWGQDLASPLTAAELAARVESCLRRAPLMVGPRDLPLHRVAWCTGSAQGMLQRAAAAGFDAFISGEISEPTVHEARELGVLYLAAGHHATERYGVQALGERLARELDIRHCFIDRDNPV